MKYLFAVYLLLCATTVGATHGNGNDDSTQASYTANCNASFQQDCPDEPTDPIASVSVAAPIGELGHSAIELVFLLIAVGMLVLTRTRSRPSPDKAQKEIQSLFQ